MNTENNQNNDLNSQINNQQQGPKLEMVGSSNIDAVMNELPKREVPKKKIMTPTLIVELIILGILIAFCLWYYLIYK